MPVARVLPTVVNFARTAPRSLLSSFRAPSRVHANSQETSAQHDEVDPELRLPKMSSLVITIVSNILQQITFFIIVSSGSKYAEFLGGSETFSGLVIGIPTVFSGLALIPLVRLDHGTYKGPLLFACVTAALGNVLYGLAYYARFLHLILIARIVMGLSFTSYLYTKRYCTDARIVGMRRRTTLAGWLVLGQSTGFSVGPFVGGLLFKIGFGNDIFNGYTSPGWIMAAIGLVFTIIVALWFEDVPRQPPPAAEEPIPLQPLTSSTPRLSKEEIAEVRRSFAEEPGRPDITSFEPQPQSPLPESAYRPSLQQWGVIGTMCWWAMTCFFVLGSWESNIPIQTAHAFGASPFVAGNLIALGGVCTFPFMLANVRFAKRVQDRHILALGASLGLIGLLVALAITYAGKVQFGSLLVCWFFVALGFNLASTVTLSLLSKQMPHHWNQKTSLFIQYSNYTGRVTGAVWGGAGVKVGIPTFLGLQIAFLGIGSVLFLTLWKELKAKKG